VTAAGTPLSASTLSAIESGGDVKVTVLWAILKFLQCPEDVAWSLVVDLPAWVDPAAPPPPTP